jgi:hypothetical protein
VVRTIDVHGGEAQGAVPRSHHVESPIAVKERGTKATGTGPPAGTARAVVARVVVEAELAVLVLVLTGAGVVTDDVVCELDPPQPDSTRAEPRARSHSHRVAKRVIGCHSIASGSVAVP